VWTVVVTADQEYFQRVVAQGGPDAHSMRFPPYYEPWSVELRGERMRVGRRRNNETSTSPEIDLTGPPGDPGISHLHCVLIERADGGWMLVDPGSRNGTTFNGSADTVDVNVPVELRDGDCIHVGAWTTLQVRVFGGTAGSADDRSA
jgi:pSer/pThr/pTyr-binding forkhead associated (FHA) protein